MRTALGRGVVVPTGLRGLGAATLVCVGVRVAVAAVALACIATSTGCVVRRIVVRVIRVTGWPPVWWWWGQLVGEVLRAGAWWEAEDAGELRDEELHVRHRCGARRGGHQDRRR